MVVIVNNHIFSYCHVIPGRVVTTTPAATISASTTASTTMTGSTTAALATTTTKTGFVSFDPQTTDVFQNRTQKPYESNPTKLLISQLY